MTPLAALRAKGLDVRLDGVRVVVRGAPPDRAKAEAWLRKHEQELRAELVEEQHAVCGMVREAFDGDGRVRKVTVGGEPIVGNITLLDP